MMSKVRFLQLLLPFFLFLVISSWCYSQELYTGRGYWQESTKENYLKIKQKQTQGDSLTNNEILYLQDYEAYLATYFARLPDEEKQKYEVNKDRWNLEISFPKPVPRQEEFEWRNTDRIVNAGYGMWYGTTLVIIAETESAATAGIPLMMGGLWLLGPVINPKKYEGITQSTIHASNTGKLLGLIYGASLGTALADDSYDADKWVLGMSSLGSIAMGEIGFHQQKKKNLSDGYIEMMRHYGITGPWTGLCIAAANGFDNGNLVGITLLAGGAAGLAIGNKVAKRYDYTRGDVDAVSTLAWISTGLGFTAVIEALNEYPDPLLLVPAAGTILGTAIGQRMVRGVHLTKKQGSALNLATAGASLIGLGIVTITESESPAVWLGVPSTLALITHQIIFNKYRKANLGLTLRGKIHPTHNYQFSIKVMPENYFFNQRIPRNFSPITNTQLTSPLVQFRLTF